MVIVRTVLCAWLALCMAACQTAYLIDNPSRPQMEREFKPGDHVTVGLRDGRSQAIRLVSYGKVGLKGDFGGEVVTIDYRDIRTIEYTRVDGARSGAAILVGVVAAAGVVIWAVHRIAKAIESHDED